MSPTAPMTQDALLAPWPRAPPEAAAPYSPTAPAAAAAAADKNQPWLTPRAKGLCLVLATSVVWVSASFVAQLLVQPSAGAAATGHMHPLLLTYISTSLFILYLPLLKLLEVCRGSRTAANSNHTLLHHSSPQDGVHQEDLLQQPLLATHTDDTAAVAPGAAAAQARPPRLGRPSIAAAAAKVGPLWFTAQFIYTVSLAYTSVTSNTILSSTAALWTLGFSVLLLGEAVTAAKLGCVVAVMAGTVLVTLADSSNTQQDQSVMGDGLAVGAAALYALYTILMRRSLAQDDGEAVARFFGYIGAGTCLGLAPVLVVLQWGGYIDVWQVQPLALTLAVVNGVLNYVVADYLWARAVLTLGPTAATVGMSAQIPLATLADAFLGAPTWLQQGKACAMTAGGTAAIMLGFVGFNMLPAGAGAPGVELEQEEGSQHSGSGLEAGVGEAGGSAGARRRLAGAHDHCHEPPA